MKCAVQTGDRHLRSKRELAEAALRHFGRPDAAQYITKRIKFSELQKGFEGYAASGQGIKAVIVLDE